MHQDFDDSLPKRDAPARRMKGVKLMAARLRERWLPGRRGRSNAQVVRFSGEIMGTTYHVVVHGMPGGTAVEFAKDAVHAALNDVHLRMSMYRPESELGRFNAHRSREPFPVSPGTAEVFRISRQVSEQSGGAFDVTVGPLVNAWGFGPEKVSADPDGSTIAALRERVGWRLVEVRDDNTLVKGHPDLCCDLSAVAKGYGVDMAAETLDRLGAGNYLVEVGGEVRTRGVNPDGQRWRLAIERPGDLGQHAQRMVGLSGVALATSGDYQIFRLTHGKRISHEIDPCTGAPIENNIASASVIHPSCAWADAYATALMVLPPDDGLAFAKRHRLAAYLLERKPSGGFVARQTQEFAKYSMDG